MYAFELALFTYHLEELKLYRKELTSNAINFVYNHKWKQRCVTSCFVCSMCQRKQTNDCHSISPIKHDYFLCTSWSYRWQKRTAIQDASVAHNHWPPLCIVQCLQPSPHVSSILVTHSSKMVTWLLGKGHFSFFLPFYFKLNSLLKSPGGECELLKHRAPYWGMTSSFECAECSSVLELHQGHVPSYRETCFLLHCSHLLFRWPSNWCLL